VDNGTVVGVRHRAAIGTGTGTIMIGIKGSVVPKRTETRSAVTTATKTEVIVIATKTAVKKVVVKTDVAVRNLAKTTTPQIMELKRAPIRIKTLQ